MPRYKEAWERLEAVYLEAKKALEDEVRREHEARSASAKAGATGEKQPEGEKIEQLRAQVAELETALEDSRRGKLDPERIKALIGPKKIGDREFASSASASKGLLAGGKEKLLKDRGLYLVWRAELEKLLGYNVSWVDDDTAEKNPMHREEEDAIREAEKPKKAPKKKSFASAVVKVAKRAGAIVDAPASIDAAKELFNAVRRTKDGSADITIDLDEKRLVGTFEGGYVILENIIVGGEDNSGKRYYGQQSAKAAASAMYDLISSVESPEIAYQDLHIGIIRDGEFASCGEIARRGHGGILDAEGSKKLGELDRPKTREFFRNAIKLAKTAASRGFETMEIGDDGWLSITDSVRLYVVRTGTMIDEPVQLYTSPLYLVKPFFEAARSYTAMKDNKTGRKYLRIDGDGWGCYLGVPEEMSYPNYRQVIPKPDILAQGRFSCDVRTWLIAVKKVEKPAKSNQRGKVLLIPDRDGKAMDIRAYLTDQTSYVSGLGAVISKIDERFGSPRGAVALNATHLKFAIEAMKDTGRDSFNMRVIRSIDPVHVWSKHSFYALAPINF